MSRTESLNRSLRNLQSGTPDIEASAVVSEDGLIIASALTQGLEESRIAAMSATLLSLGARTSGELRRGSLEQVFVKGENGYAIVMNAGPHAVLLAIARKEAKLGLIFFELRRASDEVMGILS
jgi:uncharacterized protein